MTLELTGERTLPGISHENYWFTRHVAAYAYTRAACHGKVVLDAGCGEGYGAAMLAPFAVEVMGIDSDPATTAHATSTYHDVANLGFEVADLAALPVAAGSVDVVVCLQVIEHLDDVAACLAEFARVLRPDGHLLCATPNRTTFTPGRDTPLNPFHVREFTAAELTDELAPHFSVATMLGVRHGPRLQAVEAAAGAALTDLQLACAPQDWPQWLRAEVASVTPDDFVISPDQVGASLDLVAVAVRPANSAAPVRRSGL